MKTYLTLAALLMLWASAGAQVAMTQDGRVLDSNYLVGGNGYNSVRASNRIDSNLIVNSQVTRGFGFRGNPGYLPGNQFHGSMGSADLDPFLRDSVGVGQIGTGTVQSMGIFLSPNRTILNANAIANQANSPGSSQPLTAYVTPSTTHRLYATAVEAYKPIVQVAPQPAQSNPLLMGQNVVTPPELLSSVPSAIAGPFNVEAMRVSVSTLFGILQTPQQQKQLVEDLARQRQLERANLQPNALPDQPEGQREEVPQPTSLDNAVAAPLPADARGVYIELSGPRSDRSAPAGQNSLSGPQPQPGQRPLIEQYPPAGKKGPPPSQLPPAEETRPNLPSEPTTPSALAPKTGQDIYFDLLTSLQPQRPGIVAARGDPLAAMIRRPETADQRPDQAQRPELPPQPGQVQRPGLEPPLLADRSADRTSDKLERRQNVLVLHSLAGEGPDLFNIHMRQAEDLLAKRKFYEAAQEYELAGLMDRSNPLATLGNALALLGAGEPRAAAFNLQSALQYFPPLMDTRVDVPKILGKDLATDRLALIQERIESAGEKVDPSLLMLAAFVSSSLDQPGKARQYAEHLKRIAGDDRLAAAFADRILQPASAPATLPAPAPAN